MKIVATSALVATLVVLALAKWLEGRYPAMRYVAAFAEAAAIGGLADWYAVVALFRRPLGLPFPHTAIIESNQARIADKLGEFIEGHFLGAGAVEVKLRQIDFASFIATWLADRQKSAALAGFLRRLLPDAFAALQNSGFKTFLARRVMAELEAIDLAPIAAGALRTLVDERRHQTLLDDILAGLIRTLGNPQTLAMLREKIRNELPTLLNLYRADAFLLTRIVNSATAFIEEVRADPAHPFRGEVDRMVSAYAERLRDDERFRAQLQQMKRTLLARPELGEAVNSVWGRVQEFFAQGAEGTGGVLDAHLTNAFMDVGRQLGSDADLRSEINSGAVAMLVRFVSDQKAEVGRFISEQVRDWDMGRLVRVIEINVGRDLQFIRFNGMIIGGCAGLALHVAKTLLGY